MTQEDAAGSDDVNDRFDELVTEFIGRDGVVPPGATSGFGHGSLRVDGSIFAMLVRGRLVVKLPAGRVGELVDAGDGIRFDANKGSPMKEWLALDPASRVDWAELADEAYRFVRRRRE
ncbi:hypothetical protein GCM10028798_19700 [Humibacter antri]